MKNYLLFYFFILSLSVNAQQWRWAKGIDMNLSDPLWCNMPIAVDDDENIYMTSYTSDTACIIKLNSTGNELWRKQIVTKNIHLTDAATDGNDLYVTGKFTDSLHIDNTVVLISRGGYDGFLVRIDENGNLIWIRQMGGSEVDATNSVCFDSEDNIWVTGGYSDTALFSNDTLICQGNLNMFVAKYNISGNLLYIKSAASDANMGYSYGQKIRCGVNDNLYILGGYFEMLLDTFYLPPYSSPYNDPQFLTMMDKYGVVHWLSGFGGFTNETTDFTMDADGYVYTTGDWNWTSDAHLWVSKFDLTGQQVWTRTMDRGYPCYFHSGGIAVNGDYLYADAFAELFYYAGGNFYGNKYLLLAKYDTSGTLLLMDTIPTQGLWYPKSMHYNINGNYFLINGMDYANGSPLIPSIMIGGDSITSADGNIWLAKFSDSNSIAVSELSAKNTYSIFPNPTNSSFTLNCPLSTVNSQLKIYNTFGESIGNWQLGIGNNIIDLSCQSKGVYFIEIVSGETRFVNKIVLQ